MLSWLHPKKWKRKKLLNQPWPPEWESILAEYFPAFQQLHTSSRDYIRQTIQILHAEKRLEGCMGVDITDTIRITILSQAALLLYGDISDYYEEVRSILVYPDIYTAPVQRREYDSYIVTEGFETRHGEAWSFGNIVLAWDSVRNHVRTFGNGINVAIHEFAHHLDQLYGVTDRISTSPTPVQDEPEWIWKLQNGYQTFVRSVQHNQNTFMDPYGAQSPAEFFAVASENFIERPERLKQHNAELYQALCTFYNFNPTTLYRS